MDSQEKVKTTVRLPADLHWRFQNERVRRRLSNEKAIREAFLLWIGFPEASTAKRKTSRAKSQQVNKEVERLVLESLHNIFESGDSTKVDVIRAVVEALSRPPRRGK